MHDALTEQERVLTLARQSGLSCNGIHDITHGMVSADDSMLAAQGMAKNSDVSVETENSRDRDKDGRLMELLGDRHYEHV